MGSHKKEDVYIYLWLSEQVWYNRLVANTKSMDSWSLATVEGQAYTNRKYFHLLDKQAHLKRVKRVFLLLKKRALNK